jgi:alginate O-acetyltransferase complex protein AlgI
LLVAMAIAGLWHGAAFTFLCWGLWHGVGLAVHRAWGTAVVPRVTFLREPSLLVTSASTLSTFAFVVFGWILFAATSLPSAGNVYAGLLLP